MEVIAVQCVAKVLVLVLLCACLGVRGSIGKAQSPPLDNAPLQNSSPSWPHIGEEVPLYNMLTGEHILNTTVTEVIDGHPIVSAKQRGYRIVAMHVVVANLSEDTYLVNSSQFLLIDDIGTITEAAENEDIDRNGADTRPLETMFLEPRGAMSGWLFFLVSESAAIVLAQFHGRDSVVCYGTIARFESPPEAVDGATLIFDKFGSPIGSIKVERMITDFDQVGVPFFDALGLWLVAIELTVENTGDSDWVVGDETIGVGDQIGRSFGRVVCDRTLASLKVFPELPKVVPVGESRTGIVTVSIWPDSVLVDLFYVPNEDQIFVIGHAGTETTISAEEAREVIADAH